MGMIMLLGASTGMLLLALTAWFLSYLTNTNFISWVAYIITSLCLIAFLTTLFQWLEEQSQDIGIDLETVYDQQINPIWVSPYLEEVTDEVEQAKRVLLPKRWSHSGYANTKAIKVSSQPPTRMIEDSLFDNNDGHYGFEVTYTTASNPQDAPPRYFLNHYINTSDGGHGYRLLTWQGKVSDISQAIKLDAGEGAERMHVVGVDKDWSIVSVNYDFLQAKRQVFLLEHASNKLLPITEKDIMATAALEGDSMDFHYLMAVTLAPKQVLLAVYSNSKNYDDFFSSRGRSIPRISRLFLINKQHPKGKLVSRLRLAEQGLLIAIAEKNGQWLLETLDQRNLENQQLRHFLADPELLKKSNSED